MPDPGDGSGRSWNACDALIRASPAAPAYTGPRLAPNLAVTVPLVSEPARSPLSVPEAAAGRAELERAAAAEAADAKVIRLRPDLAETYRGQVVAPEAALAGNPPAGQSPTAGEGPAGRAEAAEILRALIGKIVVTPLQRRGEVGLELYGDLAAILTLAQGAEQSGPGFVVSMVARAHYQRDLPMLRVAV